MTPPLDLSRRQLFAAAGLTAGAAFLAGCAPAATSGSTQTLQFWHLLSGGDGVIMSSLLDGVNNSQSAYRIRPTVLAWGTRTTPSSRWPAPADERLTSRSCTPRACSDGRGGLLDAWDLDRLAALGVDESTFAAPIWQKGEVDGEGT